MVLLKRAKDTSGSAARRIGVTVKSVLVAVFLLLPFTSVFADDIAEANLLMIEAVRFMQEAEVEASAHAKFNLLKRAHDNLLAIIERYPSTDLAVKLATGQRIGHISLEGVRGAMERARPSLPRKAGSPLHVWQLEGGVVALAMPPNRQWVWTAGGDGVVSLRDVASEKILRTWRHPRRPTAAAISPDGKRVIYGRPARRRCAGGKQNGHDAAPMGT